MEKKEMSFEEKIKELESIVTELESGNVNLDYAIVKYTKAMELSKECSLKLNEVTEQVNKILLDNGKLEDFRVDAEK
jgi:exodeoxyribonuclease VII small subunit